MTGKSIVSFAIILACCATALCCRGTLLNEITAADNHADDQVTIIETVEDLKAKKGEWTEAWLKGIGGLPLEKTPLKAKAGVILERDGFRIQNVMFESMPGILVVGHLFLPPLSVARPPYPVVMVFAGHADAGCLSPRYAALLVDLAKAGFAAFMVDPISQGERRQCAKEYDGEFGDCAREHTRLGVRGWLVGWNFARFRIWDAIRAIDYLETRSDLDISDLGVCGNSGGGTMSTYIQALDDRVKTAFPNCFVSSIREVFAKRGCHDAEQFYFNQLNDGLNHSALLAMGIGRVNLAVGSRYDDYFPHDGTISTFSLYNDLWSRLNPQSLAFGHLPSPWHFHCAGPHGLPAPTRAAQRDWMNFCIRHGYRPQSIEEYAKLSTGDHEKSDPANTSPLPFAAKDVQMANGYVRNLPRFKSIYTMIAERAEKFSKARAARPLKSREKLREIVRRRANIRPLETLKQDMAHSLTNSVPFRHPFGWWYIKGVYGYERENEAGMLSVLGRSSVGRDAERIILNRVQELESNKEIAKRTKLKASGYDCIAAAHAFAAEPELWSGVEFDNPPPSWTEMVKDPSAKNDSFAIAVWGALEEYDWTDLIRERPFGAGENPLSPRIRRLLEREKEKDVFPQGTKVEYDPEDESLPEAVRIGKRLKEYLEEQPFVKREDETLVGWTAFDGSVESDLYRRTGHRAFYGTCFKEYYLKPQERLAIFEWQHACLDFPKIVNRGLTGLRREIIESYSRWAGDADRLNYLSGMKLAVNGIEARARKCGLDHVPMEPARTFAEGVQSVFFCYDFMSDAIGRLDQYLAPLYFADLKAGRITRERAKEYLQELFIFIDSHTPHASVNADKGGECHMTIGGLTPDGKDGWTDFSKLVVESLMECDLIRPQMSFRWHPGTKREVLKYILDCERRDPNKRIALDGDVPRVKALVERCGFPVETARDYCITGCNEPTFMGGVSFGGSHMNALRCIERLFTERKTDVLACANWDDFKKLFIEELNHDLDDAYRIFWKFNEMRSRDCNVLSALFIEGCIANGKSPTRGGATRSCPCWDLLGTPNVIDSLCVVKQFVFDEKRCTMQELCDALSADWKGHEKLLAEIRHDGKFFGSNDEFSNAMARFYHSEVAKYADGKKDFFGLPLTFGNHTGYNDNAYKFGTITGATPDGRHAGEFLSFGGGPSARRGTSAATSTLLAAAQMDPSGAMCGTSILNLSLNDLTLSDNREFDMLVIAVETYFKQGGLHLQLNHVSRETLIDAQNHPEKYPDLRVRVSGFSGYFVRFKKSIQDEIISRTVTSAR